MTHPSKRLVPSRTCQCAGYPESGRRTGCQALFGWPPPGLSERGHSRGYASMSEPPLSLPLIRDLVAFPTVSRDPNRELLLYVEEYLGRLGVRSEILWDESRRKGNLWATIGPEDRRGA